jgi:putative addiction module component (TIGR02574 family)
MLLPPEDRAWLAKELINSLVEDEEARAFWKEEVDRRMESIENGEVETIPMDEVSRTLKEKYGVDFLTDF